MSLNTPPIDKLVEKAGNKYALSIIVAKKAKEISISRADFFDNNRKEKPVTVAAQEYYDGRFEIKE